MRGIICPASNNIAGVVAVGIPFQPALQHLVAALPGWAGFSYILIPPPAPLHEVVPTFCLAQHTRLDVVSATDGMKLAADTLYICPPGAGVSISDGALCVRPGEPHAPQALDALLKSLAEGYGARAMAVTPADGHADSPGRQAIRAVGGLVLALRDADHTAEDAPGLPPADIAAALLHHAAPAPPPLDVLAALNSADVALLLLDAGLRIRFFTPAIRAIFRLLPTDTGRPLAELQALAPDPDLMSDAAAVLRGDGIRVREIGTPDGVWFLRRVLPCWPREGAPQGAMHQRPDGVIITFHDVTERKAAAHALEEATQKADAATAAKSRFLSAVTHALRQPLQTLTLLQEMLGKATAGTPAERLVHLLETPLASMVGMLKALPSPEEPAPAAIPIPNSAPVMPAPLLRRVAEEFAPFAAERGVQLRVGPCGVAIRTDPVLFEQIMRNLLAAALHATRGGSVLLACRRRGAMRSLEIWTTRHDPSAQPPTDGASPDLSIARRLASLLGHRLLETSRQGGGRLFALEVEVPDGPPPQSAGYGMTGRVLLVAEDPELRLRFTRLLASEGHLVAEAADAAAAVQLIARGELRPELVVLDQGRAGDLSPLCLGATLRESMGAALPVIILTADTAAEIAREIALADCVQLQKPVRPSALTLLVRRLLLAAPADHADPMPAGVVPGATDDPAAGPRLVHLVDDDESVRLSLQRVLEHSGYTVHAHPSAEAFLDAYTPCAETCLLVDARLPGMSGFDLLTRLREAGDRVPAIMITGYSDVSAAVQAMKAGASEFIEKPVRGSALLGVIGRTMEQARDRGKLSAWRNEAAERIAKLTPRQRLVMERVLAGEPSKNIAADLGISRRTVETHRAAIMRQTGTRSLPALARLALAAARTSPPGED